MNFLKRLYEKLKTAVMWLLLLTGSVLILVSAFYLFSLYRSTDIFDLKKIVVKDTRILDSEKVIGISGIKKGTRIMDIDRESAVKKLNKSLYIENSKITLLYPSTIIIEIIEVEPLAYVKSDGILKYVDSSGNILGPAKAAGGYDLPIISSEGMKKTVEFLNYAKNSSPLAYHQISEADHTEKGIELYLNNSSTRVIIGDECLKKKIVILESFIKEEYGNIPFGRVDYIDLRFDGQVVMKEFSMADNKSGEL
jgi:cell division septal protein FtsQ